MTRDMAKSMSQHFMDARLIENAADPSSNLFKERGVYVLTPKGLHVLERFISKNGINADHITHVFKSQPICMKLLHLERRSVDDEIIVSQSVITALFRRFVGRQANYPPEGINSLDPYQTYQERSKGLALMDVTERSQPIVGRSSSTVQKYCFAAVSALEWLCDFTSVIGREEAAEMAAQFVRFGLIILVSDKRKNNDSAIIFTVRGQSPAGSSIGVRLLLCFVLVNWYLLFLAATWRVPLHGQGHLPNHGRRPASRSLGQLRSGARVTEQLNRQRLYRCQDFRRRYLSRRTRPQARPENLNDRKVEPGRRREEEGDQGVEHRSTAIHHRGAFPPFQIPRLPSGQLLRGEPIVLAGS